MLRYRAALHSTARLHCYNLLQLRQVLGILGIRRLEPAFHERCRAIDVRGPPTKHGCRRRRLEPVLLPDQKMLCGVRGLPEATRRWERWEREVAHAWEMFGLAWRPRELGGLGEGGELGGEHLL